MITDTTPENVRVREFLRTLYGHDPAPLRSYLIHEEVDRIMLEAGYVCLCSTHDLGIRGHSGKWRVAVEDQIRDGLLHWCNAEFWLNARLTFIELGGPAAEAVRRRREAQGNG